MQKASQIVKSNHKLSWKISYHRIGTNTPSPLAITENANVLARWVVVAIAIVIILVAIAIFCNCF